MAKNRDTSTEEKIKETAREVFHKKGYAATRTRDIAETAGINLALLNYYFRSKAKLFDIIIRETLMGFVQNMARILNDQGTSLEKKVELIASNYIDFITDEPEIPVFIISEIRNNPVGLLGKLPVKEMVQNSVFVRQHREAVENGEIIEPEPLQFLMNLIALIIFPFVAKPLIKTIGDMEENRFNEMMQKRKTLIPLWIKAMIKTG